MYVVDVGILACLKADGTVTARATNGVHRFAPPEGTLPPFLVFQPTVDVPEYAMRSTSWVDCMAQLLGVGVATSGKGGPAVAEDVRDAGIAALTRLGAGDVWPLTVTGHRVVRVHHVQTLTPYKQVVGGVERWYAPAQVQVRVAPL